MTKIKTIVELRNKFGMLKGSCVSFQKIDAHAHTAVPVGTKVEGVLQADIELHCPVAFSDSVSTLSPIRKIWAHGDVLLLQTATSLYQNIPFKEPRTGESFVWSQLHHVMTQRGSVYRYLHNGKTRRFQVAKNYLSPEKDLLVFVLNHDHNDRVLDYVHSGNGRVRVVNAIGRQMMTNGEICQNKGPIYLTLGIGTNVDFKVPVSHLPRLGCAVFDQSHYPDGSTRLHLGHGVSKIALKP